MGPPSPVPLLCEVVAAACSFDVTGLLESSCQPELRGSAVETGRQLAQMLRGASGVTLCQDEPRLQVSDLRISLEGGFVEPGEFGLRLAEPRLGQERLGAKQPERGIAREAFQRIVEHLSRRLGVAAIGVNSTSGRAAAGESERSTKARSASSSSVS